MSKSVFDANPTVNELIRFEDGTCFFNTSAGKSDALNYYLKTKQNHEIVTREIEDNSEKTTKTKTKK